MAVHNRHLGHHIQCQDTSILARKSRCMDCSDCRI